MTSKSVARHWAKFGTLGIFNNPIFQLFFKLTKMLDFRFDSCNFCRGVNTFLKRFQMFKHAYSSLNNCALAGIVQYYYGLMNPRLSSPWFRK